MTTTASPFTLVSTVSGVPSGTTVTFPYTGLSPNTCYQWYVTVSDGPSITTGPVWTFTTGTNPQPLSDRPGQFHVTERKDFIIYPNPSEDGQFHVLFADDFKNAAISVRNSIGSVVFESQLDESNLQELDLTGLHSGVYYLTVENSSVHEVRIIVKQ